MTEKKKKNVQVKREKILNFQQFFSILRFDGKENLKTKSSLLVTFNETFIKESLLPNKTCTQDIHAHTKRYTDIHTHKCIHTHEKDKKTCTQKKTDALVVTRRKFQKYLICYEMILLKNKQNNIF